MSGRTIGQTACKALCVVALTMCFTAPGSAQALKRKATLPAPPQPPQSAAMEQPDASRTKRQFSSLLNNYPPTVRGVFKQDPSLLTQEEYLKPYRVLAAFLSAHPEIALNPAYYLDGLGDVGWTPPDHDSRVMNMWNDFIKSLIIFAGFAMAIGLLMWLIRTFLDNRRWNRLSRVQAEVHTRLLDRFSTNEELMAYITTPAGSKFLQSAPISLDAGTNSRNMAAPLNRILWSVQAGLVVLATGIGLMFASGRVGEDASLPLQIMGILAIALGIGFAISAGVSFLLSRKLGLLEPQPRKRSIEPEDAQ